MYTAIKGHFENGQIILDELPPTNEKAKVVVMFLTEETSETTPPHKGVKMGRLTGKGHGIPDDFNDPIDDLKEYMW